MIDLSTAIETMKFVELPDDLREPLHSLQADLDWLFARAAADESVAGMMKDSVRNRLSQIETASYRLANAGRMRVVAEAYRSALYRIIDLDHHNHGPESDATEIARQAVIEVNLDD